MRRQIDLSLNRDEIAKMFIGDFFVDFTNYKELFLIFYDKNTNFYRIDKNIYSCFLKKMFKNYCNFIVINENYYKGVIEMPEYDFLINNLIVNVDGESHINTNTYKYYVNFKFENISFDNKFNYNGIKKIIETMKNQKNFLEYIINLYNKGHYEKTLIDFILKYFKYEDDDGISERLKCEKYNEKLMNLRKKEITNSRSWTVYPIIINKYRSAYSEGYLITNLINFIIEFNYEITKNDLDFIFNSLIENKDTDTINFIKKNMDKIKTSNFDMQNYKFNCNIHELDKSYTFYKYL